MDNFITVMHLWSYLDVKGTLLAFNIIIIVIIIIIITIIIIIIIITIIICCFRKLRLLLSRKFFK